MRVFLILPKTGLEWQEGVHSGGEGRLQKEALSWQGSMQKICEISVVIGDKNFFLDSDGI